MFGSEDAGMAQAAQTLRSHIDTSIEADLLAARGGESSTLSAAAATCKRLSQTVKLWRPRTGQDRRAGDRKVGESSKPMALESTIGSATYRSAALSVPSRLQAASFKRADAAYMLTWLV